MTRNSGTYGKGSRDEVPADTEERRVTENYKARLFRKAEERQ